ncbi:MAG: hypothetical protein E7040_01030 [Lentisphaerae bacterium]|nr:hypothetical protein [Lentisphaerota bacterium]
MKHCYVFLLFCLAWNLSAAVSVIQKGDNIVLKNDYLEAEITPVGGSLARLVNRANGTDLTANNLESNKAGGGARDRLLPGYMKFAHNKHKLQIMKNTPQEAVVQTFVRGTDAFSFVELTKTYTLTAKSARLDIKVALRNTPESMGDIDLTYGSHNYYGVTGGKNRVFIPVHNGIKKYFPSEKENKKYNNIPARGWIGLVDEKERGLVSIYDLSYSDISYSWHCGDKARLHTVEWQLKAFPTPAGEVYTVQHALALPNGLKGISGAGAEAVGEIVVPEKAVPGNVTAKIRLYGLEKRILKLKVRLGKAEKVLSCAIQPGKITEQTVTFSSVPAGTEFVICDILDEKGKKLFDLYEKVQIGSKVTPAEMADFPARKKITAGADVWNIPLDWQKALSQKTEFSWGRNSAYKTMNALVLMPTLGVRDAIELARRVDMKVTFPTIFPGGWQMAWREKVLRPGETGTDTLKEYLGQKYDLYLIGGSYRPSGDAHLSWNKLPQSTRTKILNDVRNGASLIYVNPDGLDAQLTGILKTLDQGTKAKSILASFDLAAAPLFEKTVIRSGNYGKGKIFVIKYPFEKAFLMPSSIKWAGGTNLFLAHRYDYYDYQFAVLAKLVQHASGAPARPMISAEYVPVSNTVKYTCSPEAAKVQYAVYNRYGELLASGDVPANGGTIKLPALPVGTNRLKLRVLNKQDKVLDFAFKNLKKPGLTMIRDVKWAKLPIHAGDKAQGIVRYLGSLPAGAEIQVEITDAVGRVVHRSTGAEFVFNTSDALVLSHEITAKIVKNGVVQEIFRNNFAVVGAGQENYYPTMLWIAHSNVSDYCAPLFMDLSAKYGFSLMYSGFPNAQELLPLQYSPLEVSSNTYAGLSGVLRAQSTVKLQSVPKAQKIRQPCLNDPAIAPKQKDFVKSALNLQKNFGSERFFNMGDEMSITWYTVPVDICFSQYCLPKFREYLKTIYPSLDALNKHWETEFKSWDKVMPMTFEEVLTRSNAAPWSTHREFMDKLFADNVNMQADVIRKIFPKGYYGPTGLEGSPHVYGGGTNFKHMRKLTMLSAYGDARIPLSFDRKNRMIMCYRGYKRTEMSQHINYWEGLFAGERGANHWYTWSFFQPDVEPAEKRMFYSDIMWELRSGIAALLVNSDKFTDEAAILYSHPSVRSNFIKEDKMNFYDNLLSFARYFEDRAVGYRFILPEELEDGTLNKFKVLVLPEATALSEKQVQAIRQFVKNGGTVVADYEVALEDEWNVPQSKGKLDDLFGVRQRSYGLANIEQKSGAAIKKCGKVRVTTGKAHGTLSDALNRKYPVLITNQSGKGKTLYLNFRFDYAKERTLVNDSLRTLLDKHLIFRTKYTPLKTMDGKPVGRTMTVFYNNGKNTYIGLLPDLPKGNWAKAKPDALNKFAFKAKLTLPGKSHLYNVRTGKYYGYTAVCTLDMIPAKAVMLSSLPYKVTGLTLNSAKSVKPGSAVKVAVSLKTSSGAAGHHVFHLTVKTPSGEFPWFFRQTKETANGKAVFEVPFALNAAEGTYEITIKDAATKVTETIRIQCKK